MVSHYTWKNRSKHSVLNRVDFTNIFSFLRYSFYNLRYSSVEYFRKITKQSQRTYFNTPSVNDSTATKTEKNVIQLDQQVQEAVQKYYKGSENIEAAWSVLYNLKITSGPKADIFESQCKENIADLFKMIKLLEKNGDDDSFPLEVPAYKRLSMLYEKQHRYEDAINICAAAIRNGAVEDGSKGKMYGRLARLIRKSGIQLDSSITELINK